ncbi:MAG: transcriptional repressor [Deltaproteobacteria bacterium]|nr:transcriptional repressor [Deltaproteobacteria bacterium]
MAVSPIERFRSYLAEHNLRMTRERELVLDEVFREQNHFTASELLDRLQRRDDNASRSTVYRVLPLLLQSGLIFEVGGKEGRQEQIYEHSHGPRHHDHLVCESCGDVVEFEEEDIHDALEEISRRYGYRLRSHLLYLRGVCAACQQRIIEREVGLW